MIEKCPSCGLIVGADLLIPAGDSYICPNCKQEKMQAIIEGVEPEEKKHSMLGVASFVLSLVTCFGILAFFGFCGYVAATSPGGMDEQSVVAMVAGLGFIGTCFLSLIAIGLGIAGCFQKNAKRILAILGVCFASFFLLAGMGLIMIGLIFG